MERELLFESTHTIIEYDKRHFIYIQGIGYISNKQWIEGALPLPKLIKEKDCGNLIIDQRHMKGTWLPKLSWLQKEFLPELLSIKPSRTAFIYSKDPATVQSLNRYLELLGEVYEEEFEVQAFYHPESAINWTLGFNIQVNPNTISNSLSLRLDGKHQIILIEDIYYIWSESGLAHVVTKEHTYASRITLDNILKKLPEHIQQIHRSYLVNIKKINNIQYYAGGAYKAYLKDFAKLTLPVGRKYASQLKERLGIKGNW